MAGQEKQNQKRLIFYFLLIYCDKSITLNI